MKPGIVTEQDKTPPPAKMEVTAEKMSFEVALSRPVMELAMAIELFKEIATFVANAMVDGVDYGKVIQGDSKPSLMKPGSEKLMIWWGLTPEFIVNKEVIDTPEGQIISVDSICILRDKRGAVKGWCQANCNSGENKYRNNYEWVPQWEIPDGTDVSKLEVKTLKKKSGGTFKKYRLEKPLNPWNHFNTITKMSQKRAIVGATLQATGTSDMFTQDREEHEDEASNGAGKTGSGDKPKPVQNGDKGQPESKAAGKVPAGMRKVYEGLLEQLVEKDIFTAKEADAEKDKIDTLDVGQAATRVNELQGFLKGK